MIQKINGYCYSGVFMKRSAMVAGFVLLLGIGGFAGLVGCQGGRGGVSEKDVKAAGVGVGAARGGKVGDVKQGEVSGIKTREQEQVLADAEKLFGQLDEEGLKRIDEQLREVAKRRSTPAMKKIDSRTRVEAEVQALREALRKQQELTAKLMSKRVAEGVDPRDVGANKPRKIQDVSGVVGEDMKSDSVVKTEGGGVAVVEGGAGLTKVEPEEDTVAKVEKEQDVVDNEARVDVPERKKSVEELVRDIAKAMRVKRVGNEERLQSLIAEAALGAIDPSVVFDAEQLNGLKTIEDRRMVRAYQRVFMRIGQLMREKNEVVREELQMIVEELHEQLVKKSRFEIRTVKLCKSVRGYGVYEEFESLTFREKVEQPMIVYVELDQFKPVMGQDGKYRVRLTKDIAIYPAAGGEAVWRMRPVEIVDKSQNRRRDFFSIYIMKLSPFLPAGNYNMKVHVIDEESLMDDEISLPIRIVRQAGQ